MTLLGPGPGALRRGSLFVERDERRDRRNRYWHISRHTVVTAERSTAPTVEGTFAMGFGKIFHDIGPIRIVRTELLEDVGMSVHPGDCLGTPLIVEGNAHQGKAFNDRAIGGKLLQYRGHDAAPLL